MKTLLHVLPFIALGSVFGWLVPLPILLEPRPYYNVSLNRSYSEPNTNDQGEIEYTNYLDFTFTKTQCQFHSLRIYGITFGVFEELEWFNTDNGRGNRAEGDQDLDLVIHLGPTYYREVEIRTQHFCDEELVERVFYTYNPLEIDTLSP